MKLTEKRKIWERRIADFKASGQSGVAWCAAHQLKERQLWYWLYKFKSEEKSKLAPTWVAMELDEPQTIDEKGSLLELRGHYT